MRKLNSIGDPSSNVSKLSAAIKPKPLLEEELTEAPLDSESEQVEEEVSEEVVSAFNEATLSPVELWELELERIGSSKDEAASILDTLIARKLYEETYRMGKLIFKLRTRSTVDADRVIETIHEFKPDTAGTMQHLVARINLACSLSSFGDRVFSFTVPTDDNRDTLDAEFAERYQFISNVPANLFFGMTQVLEKFDAKVNLACDSRALENF